MQEAYVKYKVENKIADIEFFHPRSNSLPGDILQKLAESVEKAGKDSSVNVIKISSGGEKAFCAGASFDELISITDYEVGKKFFMGFANVINAMRKAPKFIVLVVQGKAVGGGVGLISAADYVLAKEGSDIKLSELALGIGPFVVGPAVERKVGMASFAQMSIDYEWYSAKWALNKGFYSKMYEDYKSLHNAADQLCDKFANGSLAAMSELKKVVWEGTENWDTLLEQRAEISGKLVLSQFTKDYISDFKSKRK